jgi:hypothetical protein
MTAWARRTRVIAVEEMPCQRLCPPYEVRGSLSSKKIGPYSQSSGQGVALVPVFSLPPQARGLARRQGAMPGLLRAGCPDCSGRWGALRCTPRLAARQRGILTFMSLTVVGPGRLDSGRRGCPSTARGRKLRLPSLAGAAPVPRLQDASGRRPSNLDRDISSLGEFHQHVNSPEHEIAIKPSNTVAENLPAPPALPQIRRRRHG